jgi:hypothetical protein
MEFVRALSEEAEMQLPWFGEPSMRCFQKYQDAGNAGYRHLTAFSQAICETVLICCGPDCAASIPKHRHRFRAIRVVASDELPELGGASPI